jgi:hypothetical protein
VVLDFDLRIAGVDPNAVLRVKLVPGGELLIQLAALQLCSVARITLAPLTAQQLPCFDAVSVSLLGVPFVDFSLTALQGDLMAVPGLESAVAAAVKKGVEAYIWPQRLVVPLSPLPDEDDALTAHLAPRAAGVLLLRIGAARGLPITDAAPGASIDPYVRVCVDGHPTVAQTSKKVNTRTPVFDLAAMLPVIDPATQRLSFELWDANTLSADERVSTAELFIGEALARESAGGAGAFAGWLPLARVDGGGGVLDVSAGFAAASAGLVAASNSLRNMVSNGGGGKAGAAAEKMSVGGEVWVEFTYVPFARLGDAPATAPLPPPVPRLPAGWSLPAAPTVLTVRLQRARELRPPPAWGRPEPFVTLRLGGAAATAAATRASRRVPGLNPAFNELFEFTHVDLAHTPRLHLIVSAGPLKSGAVDAVAGAVTGAVSGAASLVTLGAVGSPRGGGDDLKLRGRGGGLLGRVPASAADAAEVPSSYDAAFCGRAVVDLADVRRRCGLAGGPVVDTLPLLDTPSGSLVCVFELREAVAVEHYADADAATDAAAADVAAPAAAPTEEVAALTPEARRRTDAAAAAAAAAAPEALPLSRGSGARKLQLFSLGKPRSEAQAAVTRADGEPELKGCGCFG